ncbi:MAG: hypothetical protein ACLGIJ_04010 [Candidatus Limnocylindria bacterium]
MGTPRPTVFCNPRDDESFRRVVERLLASATSPADLQDWLRLIYPRAVVRARDLSEERHIVWYAYREGRWVPPDRATKERDD